MTLNACMILRDGRPVLQRYGVSDDDAFAVGLTCGGILDVFVEKVNPQTYAQLSAVAGLLASVTGPAAVMTILGTVTIVSGLAGLLVPAVRDARFRSAWSGATA